MGKAKNIIRKIYKGTLFKIVQRVLRITEQNKMYIVYVDGGVCSQMQQYMIGYYLMQRGRQVKFDISWYDNYSGTGVNERKFELLKIFPGLEFPIAVKEEIMHYKKYYFYMNGVKKTNLAELGNLGHIPMVPLYIAGYYDMGVKIMEQFSKVFADFDTNIIESLEMRNVYNQILNDNNAVGVHVRRGDMAYEGGYWKVLTPDYYKNAIEKFNILEKNYYFFSDEPDWVERKIIPLLPLQTKYYVIKGNRGACVDFLLMLQCKDFIGSQGSMGKYAWLIKKEKGILIVPETDDMNIWKELKHTYNIKIVRDSI